MKKALKELAAVIAATCVSLWPVLALAQEPSRRGGGVKYTSAGGAASSGASTALDNLASVAINTSLVSDTAATDDLGSTTVPWRVGYINSLIAKSTGAGTPTIFEVTTNAATGANNTVLGTAAGDSMTNDAGNTLIGVGAGTALDGGAINNVAVGFGALDAATTSGVDNNVAVGYKAIGTGGGGGQSVAVGSNAAEGAGGSGHVYTGYFAGASASTGDYNVGLGYRAGNVNTAGDNDYNVWIGPNAGDTQTAITDYCIALGHATDCAASNETFIGVSAAGYQSKTTIGRSATGSADVQALNTEQITLSTGGTTTNSSGNIVPANSIIDAIACRVTTEITTATEWSVGITGGTAFNQIGTADATVATLTAGTTAVFVPAAFGDQYNAAATTITITTTGTPGAGAIRCAVHSRTFTPPTS